MVEPDSVALGMYEEKIAALGYEPAGFNTVKGLMDWVMEGKEPDLVLIDQLSFLGAEGASSLVATLEQVPIIIVGENKKMFTVLRTERNSLIFCKSQFQPRHSPV